MSFIRAIEPNPSRVVIAGGGVAALEAVLALRALAPAHVEVELVCPHPTFSYAAMSVAEPFGLAQRQLVDIRALAQEHGARWREDSLQSVDAKRHSVQLASGGRLHYDALLVATGTRADEVLPGALTFRGPPDTARFRILLGEIESGAAKDVVFVAARGARWPLPIYELALMTAAWAARRGVDPTLTLVTYEDRPLGLFGQRVADQLGKLLADAGVVLRTSTTALAVQAGRLLTAPPGIVTADRVVALPRLRVNPIPGLPQGPGGFIPTDEYGRVEGVDDVYAAGDATWYPVKQGGLAAQQADAVASMIAATAGADVEPTAFTPVLRGVLLTGGAPQYLRGERGRGKAPTKTPLWSPVAKVAGRYLGPYVAARGTAAGSRPLAGSDGNAPAAA